MKTARRGGCGTVRSYPERSYRRRAARAPGPSYFMGASTSYDPRRLHYSYLSFDRSCDGRDYSRRRLDTDVAQSAKQGIIRGAGARWKRAIPGSGDGARWKRAIPGSAWALTCAPIGYQWQTH